MAEVLIEYLSDSYECETCGTSYAEGYRIYVDGAVVRELKPSAHCFDGTNFSENDMLAAVLEHFGHKLARPFDEPAAS
jgi:hypothetical protein